MALSFHMCLLNVTAAVHAPCRALDRSKAELRKITLPMGPNGINQLMTWRTTYGADFEAWKSDIASSNLIAAHIKRIMQSPTATVGPVLGGEEE